MRATCEFLTVIYYFSVNFVSSFICVEFCLLRDFGSQTIFLM